MSLDESQEEDCTVYIEELKSDNASLKLNAASKISLIATVLGHNRIRDELIPYLIEIIQQMDNDNDFLIKIAEGLFELRSFCNDNKQISILIHPLRILASLDQPAVREQAITCLKKLAEDCDKNFHQTYLIPLIKQLSAKNQPYSPRVVACCLIPISYPKVNEKLQDQLRKIFRQLALQQNSPLVRRALAENIEVYASVITKTIIKSDLLDIWQAFIVDPIDIIRIKALECAHIVARAFKKQENAQRFFKFIKMVDPNKKSWRIRYSLIQSLANMLNYLDKETIKKDIVQIFEELLKDSQAEVRSIALLKSPQLAQKLSSQQSFNILFQYFQKAMKDGTKDTPPTVKLALVEAIVPYFKTLEVEKITQNGIPIVSTLLKQQNLIVRIGIVSRLKDLHQVLGKQNTVKYLVPMIQGVLTDKKWRFKLAIAQNIFSLFKTLGYDDYKQFFDKVLTTYLKDHNYAVREQTIKCLTQLKEVFNRDVLLEIITKYINLFIVDPNNIYRITALNILQQAGLSQAIDKKAFNELFTLITQKLNQQKVPNVYIVYFTMYPKIKSLLNGSNKKQFQNLSKKVQSNNGDQDVLYLIQKASE